MSRYHVRRRGTNRIYVDRRGRGGRAQTVLILLLLAALIIALVYMLPSYRMQQEEESLIRGRLLSECEAAVNRVQRLSRTAGSNSTITVAEIRSYLYAMDVLNQTHQSLTGRQLIPSSQFASLYGLIETYSSQLLAGSDTGAMQTAITAALQETYLLVQQLN
ncbi:MAG: hypothetical protein IJ708_02575 [Clostridia bacterium]|nr:hypothetical protein [Clostridia bacterium]